MGLIGWGWGVIQFILNRKYQKSDIALNKRFDVYSNFMNQMDEMSISMRTDPNMTYGIQTELLAELLTGDEQKINDALLTFNSKLLETTKKSLQPMLIVNQELNKLKLVASSELLPKIIQYKALVNDFTNEFQLVLNKMSNSTDLEQNAKELQSLGQEERGKKMAELWSDIEQLMRNEIGYYKD